MFGLFKKKNPIEELQKKYANLLKEAHQLSSVNRKESDKKTAEANAILAEIEKLKA
jgi:DNA-binding ferritin-like protein